jgi:hypothetical protein
LLRVPRNHRGNFIMLKFSLTPAPAPAKAYKLEDLAPDIKCHCCNDTGKIQPQLIKMAIPAYNPETDKQPICQRMQCGLGLKFITLIEMGMMDMRFSHDMCEEMHQVGKAEKENLTNNKPKILDLQSLINKKSMAKYHKEDGIAEARAWEKMGKEAWYD